MVKDCQQKAASEEAEYSKLRYQAGKPKLAASQEELNAWILKRRHIDQGHMDFWKQYAADMEEAKVSLATVVGQLRDWFNPDVVDLLKIDDWVEGIVLWYLSRQEKLEAEAKAEEQHNAAAASQGPGEAASQGPGVAASQDKIPSARPAYSRYFNKAAGRPLDAGPPGATCEQPPPLGKLGRDELVKFWLDMGGYSSTNQIDENGWTPLHHCVEAMVHWDQAWKIAEALIDAMGDTDDGERWLRAKTERGQPPNRTALHMLACNSDRALKKAELAAKLARISRSVDPIDDQGRTPLMHAVGTGLLDVAQALVRAGADITRRSMDGRNLADRCKGSSGHVYSWVKNDLGIKAASQGQVQSRYRHKGAVSLSRQARYDAQHAMNFSEALAAIEEADASPGGAAASQGGTAASPGGADASPGVAAASQGVRRRAKAVPKFEARASPMNPSSPAHERWEWFWDDRRQRWSWYWCES